MSSESEWPQDYVMSTRLMQAHESFVDMINGRAPFNFYNAMRLGFGMDDDADCSDSSDDWDRSSGSYCGLSRNFLQRPGTRVAVAPQIRKITHEDIKKAEKSAEELIEEEERLKKKAEKKRLKKLRQKEKKRLEKQEKENANKSSDKQNKGKDDEKKNLDKKAAESPPDADPGSNSDASIEEEDDKGSTSSEKEHPVKKTLLQKHEKKNCTKTNVDEQTIDNNETVISKVKNRNKSEDKHPDKGPECSDSSSDDLEELDMSSCFVSNAKAAFAKRQLEKVKEKKEKKDKKSDDSGKDSQKPYTEHQSSKAQQQEVTPLSAQNPVKTEAEKNPVDFIAISMELAFIGNQYAANGNLEMAVKYFTDAIVHNPREYKLFGNRSFCFEKMQQYEKSLMDANVALSMNPQWIKGLYRKGRALAGLKRYVEAMQVYKEVLTLDKSCTDAAQELMKVQILQLMEMGFTKEQSTNAMIIYGSVEKALDALSGLQGTYIPVKPPAQEEWVRVERHSQSPKPVSEVGPTVQQPVPLIQPQAPAKTQPKPVKPELFPVWVGCSIQSLTDAFIYDLFSQIGPVHSVKVLKNKGCAFVNYIRKEDGDNAIKRLHGYIVAGGIPLQVRFPDRIHPHLGMSKTAVTERSNKLPDECYFWRTTGCIKSQNCQYRHVPENKGIDRNKVK